jgi:hypothetical protein
MRPTTFVYVGVNKKLHRIVELMRERATTRAVWGRDADALKLPSPW